MSKNPKSYTLTISVLWPLLDVQCYFSGLQNQIWTNFCSKGKKIGSLVCTIASLVYCSTLALIILFVEMLKISIYIFLKELFFYVNENNFLKKIQESYIFQHAIFKKIN
jgi:hypothetical protein